MLKIITGSAKGKRIETLEGDATRPTSERIKEAIFSSLQFELEGRRVLDLFAGSGQLGLEALSRGAANCTFIDSSREAIEIVKKNAKTTGLDEQTKTLVSDYRNYLRKASAQGLSFSLVLIDPPYAMECCAEALTRLTEGKLLAKGAFVVLESGTEEFDPAAFPGFEIHKSTHYGKKTFVNILFYRGEDEA